MKNKWVLTAVLVLISASISSAATAYWFTEKHKAQERVWAQQLEHTVAAVRIEALAEGEGNSKPSLLPFWLMSKAMSFMKSKGLCFSANGQPCDVDGEGVVAARPATKLPPGKPVAEKATVAAVSVATIEK